MLACFDIGGSHIRAALSAGPGRLEPHAVTKTPGDDYAAFRRAIAGLLPAARPRLSGVALSVTGVMTEDGRMHCANIPCLDGQVLAADLAADLGLTVTVTNDADAFALGEALAGAGLGHRVVFAVILGSGIGGALVIDGRLVAGAGEWGHGTILATAAGRPPRAVPHVACGCGRSGCVNTVGGARGLERLHRLIAGADLASHEILAAWRRGEADATIDAWLDLVAPPLAYALNITGATIAPVGGGLAGAEDLVDALDRATRDLTLARHRHNVLVPSADSDRAAMTGAAAFGWQALGHG